MYKLYNSICSCSSNNLVTSLFVAVWEFCWKYSRTESSVFKICIEVHYEVELK